MRLHGCLHIYVIHYVSIPPGLMSTANAQLFLKPYLHHVCCTAYPSSLETRLVEKNTHACTQVPDQRCSRHGHSFKQCSGGRSWKDEGPGSPLQQGMTVDLSCPRSAMFVTKLFCCHVVFSKGPGRHHIRVFSSRNATNCEQSSCTKPPFPSCHDGYESCNPGPGHFWRKIVFEPKHSPPMFLNYPADVDIDPGNAKPNPILSS